MLVIADRNIIEKHPINYRFLEEYMNENKLYMLQESTSEIFLSLLN